jgi:hypothetical protein
MYCQPDLETIAYRCELRTRRRVPSETLQSLHQDIQRLASLSFQGPWNVAVDIIARDAFIDALANDDFFSKVGEREPSTLDQATRIAMRLESYRKTANIDTRSSESLPFHQSRAAKEKDDKIHNPSVDESVAVNQLHQQLHLLKSWSTSKVAELEQQLTTRDMLHSQRRDCTYEKRAERPYYKCSQPGHFARNCQKNWHLQNQQPDHIDHKSSFNLRVNQPRHADQNAAMLTKGRLHQAQVNRWSANPWLAEPLG